MNPYENFLNLINLSIEAINEAKRLSIQKKREIKINEILK